MGVDRSVLIFGAGAVGGYLAGKLTNAPSVQLTVLGRPPFVSAVSSSGLVVREAPAETVTHPHVVSVLDEHATFDLVILTVRAYDVAGAVSDVLEVAGSSGLVLAMQNGLGTDDELAESLGSHRVLAGTLTMRIGMDQPGTVTRFSRSGGVALATLDNSSVPNWVMELCAATGQPVVEVGNYKSLRWSKLLLNLLGSATSAVLDMDVADIVADPVLFRIEQLAFREAGHVMEAQGIKTTALPGYPVPLARAVMRLPRPLAQCLIAPRMARARGGSSPGMRADIKRGKSEIEQYNGAVARGAEAAGLRAPVNAALASLVRELTHDDKLRAAFRGNRSELICYLRARGVRL